MIIMIVLYYIRVKKQIPRDKMFKLDKNNDADIVKQTILDTNNIYKSIISEKFYGQYVFFE